MTAANANLYEALKPMHDDLRQALDWLCERPVMTDTPPAELEMIENARRSAVGNLRRVERALLELRTDSYVATVREAASADA